MSEHPLPAHEDYFSKMPRDCQLSVFAHIDRKTLDESECVSKAIRDVVTDPSLRKIKVKGHLFIYEQKSGHSFSMNLVDNSNSLSYNIDRSASPAIGVRSSIDKLYDKDSSYSTVYPEDKAGLRADEVVEYGSSTTVPTQIFDNLAHLLVKHSCIHPVFQWIKIDQQFLDNMTILDGNCRILADADSITFHEVQFEDELDPKRFAELLLTSKFTFIRIFNSRQNIPNFAQFLEAFGEDFLTRYAASIPDHIAPRFSFPVFSGQALFDQSPYYWTPTRDFLPILCRFTEFSSDDMQVEPKTLVEIILMCFQLRRESNYQFSLTTELTEDHLRPFIDDEQFYHYYDDSEALDEMLEWHTIQKQDCPFYCSYGLFTKPSGDKTVQVHFGELEEGHMDQAYDEDQMDEGGEDEQMDAAEEA